jgi:hypothetical protein
MRSRIVYIALILFSLNGFAQSVENVFNPGPKYYGGIVLGYNGHFGGQLNFTITNFQSGFPLSARFGLGYTSMEPGKSAAARQIFINDATNGTPEERGWMWNLSFDLLIPLSFISNSFIYLGPRYSMFTANFKYVGGNEDFDVTTNQFGLGAGLETQFPLMPNLFMVFGAGAEYFFESTLKGHDISYSPDGDDVNPRNDYSFSDADEAVNQPKILGRFMLGIYYGF